MQFEFRQVEGPLWPSNVYRVWQAELHLPAKYPVFQNRFPQAIAWISQEVGDGDYEVPAKLEYILVPDHCRRRGLAKALILACIELWPGLRLSDPISDEGEALLESITS